MTSDRRDHARRCQPNSPMLMDTSRFVTTAQQSTLLANGRRDLEGDHVPVARIRDPEGSACWLLTAIDPARPHLAYGLADLGVGAPEFGPIDLTAIARDLLARGWKLDPDEGYDAGGEPASRLLARARAAGRLTD